MEGNLEGLLAHFCDDFCRFPCEVSSQVFLDALCETYCPLVKFISQAEHSQPEKGVSGNATEWEE